MDNISDILLTRRDKPIHMKKKIAFVFFIVVSICLCVVIYRYFNPFYSDRFIFYCHLEEKGDGYIFKATPHTFGTDIFGTSVYIKANEEVTDQIDELCENKSIDLSEEICLTFDCNKIIDMSKKENTTYFKIGKVINIEQVEGLHRYL